MQNIFNGLRPAIPSHVPKLIAKLIMKCWDARPNNRPASEEIYDILRIWINDISKNSSTEIVAQIKECEETFNNLSKSDGLTTAYYYKPYPEAKYTSKFIEYTIHQSVNALNYDKKHDVLVMPKENDRNLHVELLELYISRAKPGKEMHNNRNGMQRRAYVCDSQHPIG
ncbi:20596_t:CDS:2 [Dentiscutata erythropus]|uniref:20596_t:CDS:1 n=1 Tax=Dentiscutata erythropus TaxID=1348616 RepID=A0A9N9CU99_9GLOM|nr:20596_t:CDS:2 [Dentiscutata erythropus]